MQLDAPLKLRCGAGGHAAAVGWIVWLGALLALLCSLPDQPAWLATLQWVLLAATAHAGFLQATSIHPLMLQSDGQYLRYTADGHAVAEQGTWRNCCWHSRFLTVLTIGSGLRSNSLWILRVHNSPDSYRRLSIWSRFPPHTRELPTYGIVPSSAA